MIREGMEDYEYLKLLADAGDREGAREIARELFPQNWSTDVDAATLMAAREKLATRLLQKLGKSAPTVGAGPGASGQPSAGGGCASTGGAGLAALLAVPVLLVLRRRRTAARAVVRAGR
ncbi:MAG: Synerg-CTERM sorting domain-containing protein [Anaeromyxobacter sp.]